MKVGGFKARLGAGWDNPGEPGNQVPRKSLCFTGNFDNKSRTFVAKMEYTNETTQTSQENCTPCNRRNIS